MIPVSLKYYNMIQNFAIYQLSKVILIHYINIMNKSRRQKLNPTKICLNWTCSRLTKIQKDFQGIAFFDL